MKNITWISILSLLIFSCEKSGDIPGQDEPDFTTAFVFNKSILLDEGDCAGEAQSTPYICFTSVVSDSRCPKDVNCFWEGNAEVKFRFVDSSEDSFFFSLNTHTGFTTDTIIGGYKFILKSLEPYPSADNIVFRKKYQAEIEIVNVTYR